jgi:uncharacterized membrane protein YqjE
MAGEDSTAGSARAGGVLGSIKGLAATLIAAASTRLQLFANELATEGQRVRQIALLLVLALVFFSLALVLVTLLVVVVFWDDHRLFAIGGLALLYFVASALLLLAAKNRGAAGPRPFAATLGELQKDHERLTQ